MSVLSSQDVTRPENDQSRPNSPDRRREVYEIIVARCKEFATAKITGPEIGRILGMTPQNATKHIGKLIAEGKIERIEKSRFRLPADSPEVSFGFRSGFDGVSLGFRSDDENNGGEFRSGFDGVSLEFRSGFVHSPSISNNIQEKEKEKEEIKSWGVYFGGAEIGGGILREGLPKTTDEIDLFIDWHNPKIGKVENFILEVFPTKEKNWSPNLTKRLVFAALFGLNGFSREELKRLAAYANVEVKKHNFVNDAIRSNANLTWRENPHCGQAWKIVAGYSIDKFKEHGITWTGCEKTTKERMSEFGKRRREAQRAKQENIFPQMREENIQGDPPTPEPQPMEKTPQVSDPIPSATAEPTPTERPSQISSVAQFRPSLGFLGKYRDAWKQGETVGGGKIVEATGSMFKNPKPTESVPSAMQGRSSPDTSVSALVDCIGRTPDR